jgi:hypothetical protein
MDPNVRSHRIISFGPQTELPRYCDPITHGEDVNGWYVRRGINEDGKITISAYKQFGEFRNDAFNRADIEIKVDSTTFKAPQIKAIKENDSQGTVKFVEVPDGRDRLSDSLEKDRYVERHFNKSSILTVKQYLSELIPEFDSIVSIPKLNEVVARIKDEMPNVQRDREKFKVSK